MVETVTPRCRASSARQSRAEDRYSAPPGRRVRKTAAGRPPGASDQVRSRTVSSTAVVVVDNAIRAELT